jgi:hypothetical protein
MPIPPRWTMRSIRTRNSPGFIAAFSTCDFDAMRKLPTPDRARLSLELK